MIANAPTSQNWEKRKKTLVQNHKNAVEQLI
jgi:hypothetical protein